MRNFDSRSVYLKGKLVSPVCFPRLYYPYGSISEAFRDFKYVVCSEHAFAVDAAIEFCKKETVMFWTYDMHRVHANLDGTLMQNEFGQDTVFFAFTHMHDAFLFKIHFDVKDL